MQNVVFDDTSLSTDLRSDISFMNKQKELRNLYRDFKSAISSIQAVNQQEEERALTEDEEEEYASGNDAEEDYEDSDIVPNDVDLILQEIEMLETETEEILSLLGKTKLANNPRTRSIKKQLAYVNEINQSLHARAVALAGQKE